LNLDIHDTKRGAAPDLGDEIRTREDEEDGYEYVKIEDVHSSDDYSLSNSINMEDHP
jgi:hypothetical protein